MAVQNHRAEMADANQRNDTRRDEAAKRSSQEDAPMAKKRTPSMARRMATLQPADGQNISGSVLQDSVKYLQEPSHLAELLLELCESPAFQLILTNLINALLRRFIPYLRNKL